MKSCKPEIKVNLDGYGIQALLILSSAAVMPCMKLMSYLSCSNNYYVYLLYGGGERGGVARGRRMWVGKGKGKI